MASNNENVTINGTIVKDGEKMCMCIPLENMGDAQPNDVRKGKTFTAAGGHKAEGTLRQWATGAISVTQPEANYTIDTGLDSVGYFVISKISGNIDGLESYAFDGNRQGGVVRASDGVYHVAGDLVTIDGGKITINTFSPALNKNGCSVNGTYRWMAREE